MTAADPVFDLFDLGHQRFRKVLWLMTRDHIHGRPVLLDIHDLRNECRRPAETYHADISAGLIQTPDLRFGGLGANRSFERRTARRSRGRSNRNKTRDGKFKNLKTAFDDTADL